MRRSAAPLLLAGLVAFTAAGCGGSSNRTETYSALISKASAICKSVTAKLNSDAAAKKYDAILSDAKAAQAKLKALTPPDQLKDSYNAYLAAQQKSVDDIPAVVAALKSGDQAALKTATAAGTANDKATNAAADAAGLPACGSASGTA